MMRSRSPRRIDANSPCNSRNGRRPKLTCMAAAMASAIASSAKATISEKRNRAICCFGLLAGSRRPARDRCRHRPRRSRARRCATCARPGPSAEPRRNPPTSALNAEIGQFGQPSREQRSRRLDLMRIAVETRDLPIPARAAPVRTADRRAGPGPCGLPGPIAKRRRRWRANKRRAAARKLLPPSRR